MLHCLYLLRHSVCITNIIPHNVGHSAKGNSSFCHSGVILTSAAQLLRMLPSQNASPQQLLCQRMLSLLLS